MTQAQVEPKLYSFDEFISWYPENSQVRYELHDGVIIEMPKPKGKNLNLTYRLSNRAIIDNYQANKLWRTLNYSQRINCQIQKGKIRL